MNDTTNISEGRALKFAGTEMFARPSGSLWVPGLNLLVIADLHLGKAERNARRGGGLWPPYENSATLSRIEAEIDLLAPTLLVLLGDSFDDNQCVDGLAVEDQRRLASLAEQCEINWITGNHDSDPDSLPGKSFAELVVDGVTFRHIPKIETSAEISGHFHPMAKIRARSRTISRKCFLFDSNRMILPAFGTYTGGLDVADPVFEPLFGEDAEIILSGSSAVRMPLQTVRQSRSMVRRRGAIG